MKKKILTILMILLLFIPMGCNDGDEFKKLNMEEINVKMKEGNFLDKVVKDYNNKFNKNLDASKMEVYSVKPYYKGCLVLIGYRGESLELKLFYIQKDKDNLYHLREAKGQFLPKLSVNSLKDGLSTIYFGNLSKEYTDLDNNSKETESKAKIYLKQDNGNYIEENIKPKDKGYIIVVNSQGMVVDLTFYNVNNEPLNYIKEFVNYSQGIYETEWSMK